MSNSGGRPGRFGAGKVLISLVAAETAVGPYLADWNETHIYNPAWLVGRPVTPFGRSYAFAVLQDRCAAQAAADDLEQLRRGSAGR
jgi:hypothetical protein